MMRLCAILASAAFYVRPLPQADGPLEPSVQNEVDHAVDMGERWLAGHSVGRATGRMADRRPQTVDRDVLAGLGLTNGMSRVDVALKLVSSQRSGGWWLTETNAVPTCLAVEILKGL